MPDFEKRIEFMTLLDSNFDKMKAPNLTLLNKYYGKIGDLLHYPKFEIYIDEIYDNLQTILEYIEKFNEPQRCFLELNVEGEKICKKYLRDELTYEDLEDIKRNGNKYYSGGLYRL